MLKIQFYNYNYNYKAIFLISFIHYEIFILNLQPNLNLQSNLNSQPNLIKFLIIFHYININFLQQNKIQSKSNKNITLDNFFSFKIFKRNF